MCGGPWVAKGHSGGVRGGVRVLAAMEVDSLARDFMILSRGPWALGSGEPHFLLPLPLQE